MSGIRGPAVMKYIHGTKPTSFWCKICYGWYSRGHKLTAHSAKTIVQSKGVEVVEGVKTPLAPPEN